MVNTEGQLYTIEGIVASLLILTTVYLILTTTTVFTPGETHIYDMQLEQLGNDVLAVMDTSPTWGAGGHSYPKSPLESYIEDMNNDGGIRFKADFLRLANMTTGGRQDDLKFTATITYRNELTGMVEQVYFPPTNDYHRERAVKVTRWVNVDNRAGIIHPLDHRIQTVLLEVLLWRG